MAVLADDEIRRRLVTREGWEFTANTIVKKFELPGFMDVVVLVNAVAGPAEAADHHPDMTINYRRITFTLATHDQGGVTEKDFALLAEIEKAAAALA